MFFCSSYAIFYYMSLSFFFSVDLGWLVRYGFSLSLSKTFIILLRGKFNIILVREGRILYELEIG